MLKEISLIMDVKIVSSSSEFIKENIVKSKKRTQNHGEVFTPKRIVNQMLDQPNILDACQNLTTTFLEPGAGEGAFLVEILRRKMNMVIKNYGDDLTKYENYSLLALSTLYGIELLEDNSQKCVMNMYQVYFESYQKQAIKHGVKVKNKVLESAKLIISNNIAQGNFFTKLSANGEPIIFSEWQPVNFSKQAKTVKIQRTDYTLEEIFIGTEKEKGDQLTPLDKVEQLDLFAMFDEEEVFETKMKRMIYVPIKITEIYKEKMEEANG